MLEAPLRGPKLGQLDQSWSTQRWLNVLRKMDQNGGLPPSWDHPVLHVHPCYHRNCPSNSHWGVAFFHQQDRHPTDSDDSGPGLRCGAILPPPQSLLAPAVPPQIKADATSRPPKDLDFTRILDRWDPKPPVGSWHLPGTWQCLIASRDPGTGQLWLVLPCATVVDEAHDLSLRPGCWKIGAGFTRNVMSLAGSPKAPDVSGIARYCAFKDLPIELYWTSMQQYEKYSQSAIVSNHISNHMSVDCESKTPKTWKEHLSNVASSLVTRTLVPLCPTMFHWLHLADLRKLDWTKIEHSIQQYSSCMFLKKEWLWHWLTLIDIVTGFSQLE